MNPVNKERFQYFLAGAVFISGIIYAGLLIFFPIPSGNENAVMLAAGQVLVFAGMVVGYFFGSSKGSSDKTTLMADKGIEDATK